MKPYDFFNILAVLLALISLFVDGWQGWLIWWMVWPSLACSWWIWRREIRRAAR